MRQKNWFDTGFELIGSERGKNDGKINSSGNLPHVPTPWLSPSRSRCTASYHVSAVNILKAIIKLCCRFCHINLAKNHHNGLISAYSKFWPISNRDSWLQSRLDIRVTGKRLKLGKGEMFEVWYTEQFVSNVISICFRMKMSEMMIVWNGYD